MKKIENMAKKIMQKILKQTILTAHLSLISKKIINVF